MDRLSALDVSFLTNESSSSHMHVGGDLHLRGPADELRGPARPHPLAPAPRPALPPEARLSAGADRATVLGRRPELQPRVPRPPFGAAVARLGGAAAQDGGADLLAAARPDQAAVGAVAGPGPDPQPLRLASPRPTTRSSTASRESTSRPCCSTSSRFPSPPSADHEWVPGPEPSGAAAAGQGRRGPARTPVRLLRRLERAVEHPRTRDRPGLRGGRGARRGRLELRQPGAAGAAQRRDRLPPAVRVGARRPGAVQADQVGARRDGQRRRPGGGQRRAAALAARRAASAPRGWSCAPRSRSRSAPPTSTASSATRSPPCAARSPSTSRTRSSA